MPAKKYDAHRFFLKDTIRQQINFAQTEQAQGRLAPPLQKPCPADVAKIDLPAGKDALIRLGKVSLGEAIAFRESVRDYKKYPLTLEELAALLWATQGVRCVVSPETALRCVPSAGARHCFETYLIVNRVQDLPAGIYRYLPFEEKLAQLKLDEQIGRKAAAACFGQNFIASCAVAFFWTAIPARMEWRYDLAAHKVIAVDAGHVGQNLYLACQSIDAGCCTVAAYNQSACDELLGVDGEEEFTIYLAAAGKY